jgi:hypothetical protein
MVAVVAVGISTVALMLTAGAEVMRSNEERGMGM